MQWHAARNLSQLCKNCLWTERSKRNSPHLWDKTLAILWVCTNLFCFGFLMQSLCLSVWWDSSGMINNGNTDAIVVIQISLFLAMISVLNEQKWNTEHSFVWTPVRLTLINRRTIMVQKESHEFKKLKAPGSSSIPYLLQVAALGNWLIC